MAASKETTASSAPRCSWVKIRPPTTAIDDQPGPTRLRQRAFGGVRLHSDGTFTPWTTLAPSLAIFLTVLAFNLVADAIRDAIDPQGAR